MWRRSPQLASCDSPPILVGEYGDREGTRVRVTGRRGKGQEVGAKAKRCPHATPNKALHLTAYSVRSCVASASGSR
jgi:hypothetical protein